MTTFLYIAGGSIFLLLSALLFTVIRFAIKSGELSEKIEEDKVEIQTQKKYSDIASRPSDDADAILDRMRRETANK